jgi:hypothetical protein
MTTHSSNTNIRHEALELFGFCDESTLGLILAITGRSQGINVPFILADLEAISDDDNHSYSGVAWNALKAYAQADAVLNQIEAAALECEPVSAN